MFEGGRRLSVWSQNDKCWRISIDTKANFQEGSWLVILLVLNVPKIKEHIHMKSGIVAGEALFNAAEKGELGKTEINEYSPKIKKVGYGTSYGR